MLPDQRDRLVEQLAEMIERKGVSAPAVLFLEAHKPLSFVASHALLMLQPLLNVAFDCRLPIDTAMLLEDRANVELLIQRLERGRE